MEEVARTNRLIWGSPPGLSVGHSFARGSALTTSQPLRAPGVVFGPVGTVETTLGPPSRRTKAHMPRLQISPLADATVVLHPLVQDQHGRPRIQPSCPGALYCSRSSTAASTTGSTSAGLPASPLTRSYRRRISSSNWSEPSGHRSRSVRSRD